MKLLKILNVSLVLLSLFLGYQLTQFYRLVRVKIGVRPASDEMEQIFFLYNLIWVSLVLILIGLVVMLIMKNKICNKSA